MANRLLKSPDDVRRALQRRCTNNRSLWLAGTGNWPLVLALGQPLQSDARQQPDAIRHWVRAWQDVVAAGTVEWQERQWSDLGRQQLPVRLILNSPEEVADWIGEGQQWRRARARYDRLTGRWARLSTCLHKHFDTLAEYSERDFERLTNMLAWLEEHPQSNLFPRQLPVVGLDSKWLESRMRLIAELVGAVRKIDTSALDFWQCCGLRPLPHLMRIAILDPALRARTGGIRDLTAPVEDLACLELPARFAFIVENMQTGLAFEDLEATIVVMGLGYGVDAISRLSWIRQMTAFYWGDIDTHGFAILSRARRYLPDLQSMMMDEATLRRHHDSCGEEPEQHSAESLPNLTEDELAVYWNLKHQTWGYHLRLEQERIPWPEAWLTVQRAHRSCL